MSTVLNQTALDKLKWEKDHWNEVVENSTFEEAVEKFSKKYNDPIDVILEISRIYEGFLAARERRIMKEEIKNRILELSKQTTNINQIVANL